MKIKSDQLPQYLKQNFATVFLVSGDEILLVNEAVDLLRAKSRTLGFEERIIFTIDRSFEWGAVLEATQTLSLFSEKRWIELRIADGKAGDGAKIIEQFTQHPPSDIVLVVVTGKLDKATQNTKWVKAIDGSAVNVTCAPVGINELPAWITARMRTRGMQPTLAASKLLSERVEGNLLAAMQEIEKLALVHQGTIDEHLVIDAVAESARYDIFGLSEALLAGDATRALRILEGLRETGTEPPLVLWACTRELRILARVAATPIARRDQLLSDLHVWQSRAAMYRKASARLSVTHWYALLQHALKIDRTIKGMAVGKPWDELTRMSLEMVGKM